MSAGPVTELEAEVVHYKVCGNDTLEYTSNFNSYMQNIDDYKEEELAEKNMSVDAMPTQPTQSGSVHMYSANDLDRPTDAYNKTGSIQMKDHEGYCPTSVSYSYDPNTQRRVSAMIPNDGTMTTAYTSADGVTKHYVERKVDMERQTTDSQKYITTQPTIYQYQVIASQGSQTEPQPVRLVSTISQQKMYGAPKVIQYTETVVPHEDPTYIRQHESLTGQQIGSDYITSQSKEGDGVHGTYEPCCAEDFEAAIACGRIYAPTNAAFVPGEVVKQAGIATTYDSSLIPTFEHELEVTALPRPLQYQPQPQPQQYEPQQNVLGEINKAPIEGTGLMKRVTTQARRRMYCCQ